MYSQYLSTPMLSTKIHGGSHVYYQCFSTPILVQITIIHKGTGEYSHYCANGRCTIIMPPPHPLRSLEQTKHLDTVLLLNHPAGGTPN